MNSFKAFVTELRRQKVAAPVFLLMLLGMIMLPLPPVLLDVLFTFNIVLALIVILVAVSAKRPLDFSVFPTVILGTTLMRLALNVASTRVVLLKGHEGTHAAGNVIEAFGNVVIGGNFVVGLVVFVILMIINFIVVTKGAERQQGALWWPFCRIMALLSIAPVIGDGPVPVPVRALLSLVLAFLMLPLTRTGIMPDPFSLHGVVAMAEQAVIGGAIGFALQFATSAIAMLGYLASSQIGFSMAQMNDPLNGQTSDVVSSLLGLVAMMVFFAIDGHVLLATVLGHSFHAWPVGAGWAPMMLHTIALNLGWVFAAALLLALPIVFSTLVVQIGFGFLNRVAPSLNLFSLGFSLVTIFGLMMLVHLVRFIPEHYIALTNQVLEMLQAQMKIARG